MRKKATTPKNNFIFEIIAILCSFCLLVFSFLADLTIIPIPDFFALNINDVENLFFTLFTVQASVSTVSIAIVSIITGLINEYVLGISISGFITNLKPKLFKHNRLIITNLLVTFLNYICLSYTLFNLCIALFAISIFITILLIREIYVVFLGKNNIRSEVEDFVLNNYNADILNSLHAELLSAIEIGNTLVTNTNLGAIKKIFEKEVVGSNYKMTPIIKQLSEIICDAFDKITFKHNSQKSNNFLMFICDIYSLANKNTDNPLHLDIWDNLDTSFFRAIQDLEFEQLKEDGVYYRLHAELCKNLIGRDKEKIRDCDLKYYASWMYSLLIKNTKLQENEKSRIKKNLYDMLHLALFFRNFNKKDEAFDSLLVYETCNFHKTMIDNGDYEGITKLFFEHAHYNNDKNNHTLIYIITMIYLYYLAKRESLVDGAKLQTYANKILADNHNTNSFFYLHINILQLVQDKLPFIRTILRGWEYMDEGEAKWMIIEHVIDDFFVFIALGKFWEKDLIENVVKVLAPHSMFSLYDRYFAKNNGETVKKLYAEFEALINKEKDEELITEKISILGDVFNKRYRDETISEGKEKKITAEQKEWFTKKVIENLEVINTKILTPFKFNEDDLETAVISLQKQIVYKTLLSYYFFEEKTFDEHIKKHMFTEIITSFVRSFIDRIEYKELSYSNKEKQKTLIDLAKKSGINATVAIGNRDEFWGEEDSGLLKKYTENMQRIKYPGGYNYYFLLDNSLIEFSMENITVEYKDPTWDNFKHKCKDIDSDNVLYNVTNDIYIPFPKNEVEEYIKNTEKIILVYADIKLRLKGEKVGVGIEITTDKE